MKPDDYLIELERAIDEYRFDDVQKLNEKINPKEFNSDQAKKSINMMRRKQLFPEIETAASLFIMSGEESPTIKRQYAQALINQNRISQALGVLENLAKSDDLCDEESSEVKGLIGRAYKQQYINGGVQSDLQNSIKAYSSGWEKRQGDHRWHGINVVGLLSLAEAEGISPGVSIDRREIAQKILEEIQCLEQKNVWDYGTASEAAIAIDDHEAAFEWVGKYIQHPSVDAFELGSTLRQLKEVWRLQETRIGEKILPVLEFSLLQREGGELQLTTSSLTDKSGFEAVFGNESAVNIQWMETLLQRSKAVARISNKATGSPAGTGFLMNGSSLSDVFGGGPVFVTNSHVVSNNPLDEAPLQAEDVIVEFTTLPNRPRFGLCELLFTSPKIELDVSVFRIDLSSDVAMLNSTPYLPLVATEGDAPQRIYVVGHPGGGDMTITLYDNDLVGYVDNKYVHYRSPTEGGNSGSPVFTREWKLFAIHHRAVKGKQVNEGVLMRKIIEGLA